MKQRKIISILLCLMLIISLMPSYIINPKALDDEPEEITENIDEGGEDTTESQVCEHVFGDWVVETEATEDECGLKYRVCSNCGERQEEEIPKVETETIFIPEENVIVESTTNIPEDEIGSNLNLENSTFDQEYSVRSFASPRMMSAAPNATTSETKILIYTTVNGFTGTITYTAYNSDGNEIIQRSVGSGGGSVTLRVPTGQYAEIICTLSGEHADEATQTVKKVSGTFNSGTAYSWNVTVTYIEPCRHTNTSTTTVDATYSRAGYTKVTCNDCGEIISVQSIPKLTCSHANTTETVVRAATETKTGSARVVCADCGAFIRMATIPKKEHVHTYTENTIDSTCSQLGYKTKVCTTCAHSEIVETIPLKEHSWNEGVVTKEASCGVAGTKKYTCSVCGAVRTEDIPMLIHDYVLISTTPATCANTGERVYKCSHCGDVVRSTIRVNNNHDWSGQYVTQTAPTCTQKGLDVLYCTRCNKKIDEMVTNEVPHNYAWVVTEATEEADGLKEYKCRWCGHVSQSEVIPKLQSTCTHESKRSVQVAAGTCKDREIVDIYCNDCDELLNYHVLKYTDPDNHVGFEETIETPATYDAVGTKKFTCTGCGYSYTTTIPKLVCLHPQTCVKNVNGRTYKECEICGKDLGDVPNVLNCTHSGYARNEVVVTPATPTQWGEYNYVCSHCGKVLDTKRVHPYSEYHLTDQNGNAVTIYGWFDDEWSQEVFNQLNDYRAEKGLNRLHYNYQTQDASNTRVLEAAIYFSHTKPNGAKWNTTCSQWQYGGENIASGQTTPTSVMTAWKNSEGHNENMLYGKDPGETPFKGVSVGVFHRFLFNSSSKPSVPNEVIVWGQQFTFYEY